MMDTAKRFRPTYHYLGYLMAYALTPQGNNPTTVTKAHLDAINPAVAFDDYSVAALADAVDYIARIWFCIWRSHLEWERNQNQRNGFGLTVSAILIIIG